MSEDQFQRELHRARATGLVERVQNAERIRQRTRCLAERFLTKHRIDGSEIRVIEDVKSFCTELECEPFVDWELAPYREVHLPGSEAPREVTRNIAKTRTHFG